MAMTMRRTRHKLEPQCDQPCKQGNVQQTRTTTTKKRHCTQTSSAVVHSTALTSLQLMFSWVSTCFRFAATLNMLLCLSLCIRVITSLVVNVPTYSLFTCMWIPCRFCRFSHCENGSFEVFSLHTPSVTVDRRQLYNKINSWKPFVWGFTQRSNTTGFTVLCILFHRLSLYSYGDHQDPFHCHQLDEELDDGCRSWYFQ